MTSPPLHLRGVYAVFKAFAELRLPFSFDVRLILCLKTCCLDMSQSFLRDQECRRIEGRSALPSHQSLGEVTWFKIE